MPKNAAGHLIPGTVAPEPAVPKHIARPEYVGRPAPARHEGSQTYTHEEVERIREAGRIAADTLEALATFIAPGVTTEDINRFVFDRLVAENAYPSTLGYRGFPKSCCTSVNEVVVHGIPDDTVLDDGDVVNVDVTAYAHGMHGDTNRTFLVGEVREEVAALVDAAREATARGIRAARAGRRVNVIGHSIDGYATRHGYGNVREFTGHGVGRSFHSGLIIPPYDAPEYDDVIEQGMVFTVEPILALGSRAFELWPDGWTAVTRDKSWTAQFEHTVTITPDGAEILTSPSTGEPQA